MDSDDSRNSSCLDNMMARAWSDLGVTFSVPKHARGVNLERHVRNFVLPRLRLRRPEVKKQKGQWHKLMAEIEGASHVKQSSLTKNWYVYFHDAYSQEAALRSHGWLLELTPKCIISTGQRLIELSCLAEKYETGDHGYKGDAAHDLAEFLKSKHGTDTKRTVVATLLSRAAVESTTCSDFQSRFDSRLDVLMAGMHQVSIVEGHPCSSNSNSDGPLICLDLHGGSPDFLKKIDQFLETKKQTKRLVYWPLGVATLTHGRRQNASAVSTTQEVPM